MYPKVTIMIPTYNQEEYISAAIESALAQDYRNLEVLVTDDCSSDRTGEIVRKYEKDPRFRYIRNEVNLGRVGNYHNTLYKYATGEWVINLDGDDYYSDSNYISRAINRIKQHDDVSCYFAKRYISDKLRRFKDTEIDKETWLFDGTEFFLNYFKYGGFAHAGAIYRRDIALRDHLCYTYPGIQSDFHGIIRYTVLGKVIFTHDSGYVWRLHGDNATTSVKNKKKYKSEIICQEAIIRDLPNGILSDEEKRKWLEDGRKWARHQYVLDNLNFSPSVHTIVMGVANFKFSISYIIIFAKSFLRFLGVKIKV